jgi:hypothetical protein
MLDVKADRVVLLGGGARSAGGMDRSVERRGTPVPSTDEAPVEVITDDDIPF